MADSEFGKIKRRFMEEFNAKPEKIDRMHERFGLAYVIKMYNMKVKNRKMTNIVKAKAEAEKTRRIAEGTW